MSNASFPEIGKAAEHCRKKRYPGGKVPSSSTRPPSYGSKGLSADAIEFPLLFHPTAFAREQGTAV